jgi:hypothetical protein
MRPLILPCRRPVAESRRKNKGVAQRRSRALSAPTDRTRSSHIHWLFIFLSAAPQTFTHSCRHRQPAEALGPEKLLLMTNTPGLSVQRRQSGLLHIVQAGLLAHWPNRRWIAVESVAASNRFRNSLSENTSDTVARIRRCSSFASSGTRIMKKTETGRQSSAPNGIDTETIACNPRKRVTVTR